MNIFLAQLKSEIRLVLRNGEQLLLTLGIPVMLLIFFSLVDVLPTGESDPINFLAPGVLSLAVMSTAMVSLGISTGFERSYHVFKRLGLTPLGTPRLVASKICTVLVVEIVQFVVLIPVAFLLGWVLFNLVITFRTHYSVTARKQSHARFIFKTHDALFFFYIRLNTLGSGNQRQLDTIIMMRLMRLMRLMQE